MTASTNPNFGKHLWIRIDGDGNAIAGTDIWSKRKPVNGRWKEIVNPNLCCNPVYGGTGLDATIADVTDTNYTLEITCDASPVLSAEVTLLSATTDIYDIRDAFSKILGSIGNFSVIDEDTLHLELSPTIVDMICTGTLAMTVTT